MKLHYLFLPLLFLFGSSIHAAHIPFLIDGEDATWVQSNFGSSPGEPGGIVEQSGYSWLRTGRAASPSTVTTGYYYNAGDTTATERNQFSDFTGSVIFMGTGGTTAGRGIAIRNVTQSTANSGGNAFRNVNQYLIQQRGDGLGIYYGVGDNLHNGSNIDQFELAYTSFRDGITWQANTQYQITFTVSGTNIEADIWLWDADNDSPLGESLAHVIYTNATERDTGYVGLRGFRIGQNNVYSYYRDFHITAIPEPSTLLMLSVPIIILGFITRRRVKNYSQSI